MVVSQALPGTGAVYAMHRRWLGDVLGAGDSLFTPGTAVWTAEHLDELERDFTSHPDITKGKAYLDKLRGQLADASPGAVQLMAELHVVHFLIIWIGAISAARKRTILEAIVSWMPVPCTIPADVLEALSPGIVHPGQWVMTRRDTQLAWLIRFARAWADLTAEQQRQLTADPWEMKAFAETIHAASAESARLALLHLAHPDTFEPIVSSDHKNLIAGRFADVAGTDPDIDRRLLAARAALTQEYGEGFDWYADLPLRRWLKNRKTWPAFLTWLQRLHDLPGPAGQERQALLAAAEKLSQSRAQLVAGDRRWTGLFHEVLADPDQPYTDDPLVGWIAGNPGPGGQALQALWADAPGPAARLQEFLGQLPAAAQGPDSAQLRAGAWLLSAEDPASLPPADPAIITKAWMLSGWGNGSDLSVPQLYERELAFLDEIVRDSASWGSPLRDRLDAYALVETLVLYPAKPQSWPGDLWHQFTAYRGEVPGAGSAGEVVPGDEDDLAEVVRVDYIAAAAKGLHIDRAVLDEIVELLDDKGQVVLYGPPGTGKTHLAVRLAHAITQDDRTRMAVLQFHPATSYEDFFEGLRPQVTPAGQVTYTLTSGPLVAIAEKAAADPARSYVLVIDEINRANLPKVFGELLFLMEDRTEPVRTLYRPEEPFQLPGNVWFIGTMNTADRSVAVIDAAMRRRFHFVPFFPHDGPMKDLLRSWLGDEGGRVGVADLLDAVNEELLSLVGEHLLIGPSHFMKTDLSDRALARIWTYNVFPLIEEQLWGDRDAITRWRWDAVRRRFAQTLSSSAPPAGPSPAEDDTGDPSPS